MQTDPVAVIGAGPAGLAAAHELAGQGFSPLVLERTSAIGGLARTELHDGYRVDVGGHRFYTHIQPIQRDWQDMLGEDFLTVRRLSRIYYNNLFFKYPLQLRDTLGNLGLGESGLILLSYLKARLLPHRPEESFETWVTNRFGRRLFRTFFQAYTEKVWGIPCNVLRADWAAQRIGKLSLASVLGNVFLRRNGLRTLAEQFQYPRLGPGMLWEKYQRQILLHRGQFSMCEEVLQLDHDGRSVRDLRVRRGPQLAVVPVRQVISSMPLSELVACLRPQPPAPVLRAAEGLKSRSFLLVALIVNRPHLFDDNWLYIHSPAVRVGRIQNYKNWSREMVPDPSRTCLGMEYFCNRGDELWRMDDQALVSLAGGELARLGLAAPEELERGFVIREAHAYPVYDQDYRRNLDLVRGFLGTLDNLQVIGRSGMHRYNNQDHSMLTGILAARNLLGQQNDLWAVNVERGQASVPR
jgi:protoporphyrinogen oxidase